MNVDTGELIRFGPDPETEEFKKLFEQGFYQVPANLLPEAVAALGNNDRVMVDLAGDTPLAKWAAKKRKNARRNKRKQQKAGRRANRR